jgi:hypothetical protein
MIDLNRPQPDYAAMSQAAPMSEWTIPRLIADAWVDGDDDERRKIDRDLERMRRQGEVDHLMMMHAWTFGKPAL